MYVVSLVKKTFVCYKQDCQIPGLHENLEFDNFGKQTLSFKEIFACIETKF